MQQFRSDKWRHQKKALWLALAVWAFVFVSPLFMILRELAGPGREVFHWLMGIAPLALLAAIVIINLKKRRDGREFGGGPHETMY